MLCHIEFSGITKTYHKHTIISQLYNMYSHEANIQHTKILNNQKNNLRLSVAVNDKEASAAYSVLLKQK